MHKFLSKNQQKIIGIYGGVGPLAHTIFEQKLIEAAKKRGAKSDQEIPVWITVNAASTPNRATFATQNTENPIQHFRFYSELLKNAGATKMYVVCNGAHFLFNELSKDIQIDWVNMITKTAEYISNKYNKDTKVGILGTDATLKFELYSNELQKFNIKSVSPELGSKIQQNIMDVIYSEEFGIKATGAKVSARAKNLLRSTSKKFLDKNPDVKVLVAGCTELSIVIQDTCGDLVDIIDPLDIYANDAINYSFNY